MSPVAPSCSEALGRPPENALLIGRPPLSPSFACSVSPAERSWMVPSSAKGVLGSASSVSRRRSPRQSGLP